MFTKTTSQKIARIFEIAGYLLTLPAVLSLIYPFFGLAGGLLTANGPLFLLSLLPFGVAGVGFALLAGYRKHARGTLSDDKIAPLWLVTLFFNGLPLVPAMILFCRAAYLSHTHQAPRFDGAGFVVAGGCVTWLAVATFLAGFALAKEWGVKSSGIFR